MEANPRVVFVGPAGTGEDTSCIGSSSAWSERRKKSPVSLFQSLTGEMVRTATFFTGPNVVARTIHQQMLTVSQTKVVENPDQTYWGGKLPELAIETLLENADETDQFDELVVDEAQDILRREIWTS